MLMSARSHSKHALNTIRVLGSGPPYRVGVWLGLGLGIGSGLGLGLGIGLGLGLGLGLGFS